MEHIAIEEMMSIKNQNFVIGFRRPQTCFGLCDRQRIDLLARLVILDGVTRLDQQGPGSLRGGPLQNVICGEAVDGFEARNNLAQEG